MTYSSYELPRMRLHIFDSEQAHLKARGAGLIGEDDLVLTPDTGLIDGALDDSSTNPVENRAIKAYVDNAISALRAELGL